MIHKQFIIPSREGEKLRADLRFEPDGKKKPVIIFVHGFKGFKNWGPFPAVCEQIAAQGFVSIAFNFSHNGVGEDLMNFTELDRFADNTFSLELDELADVINEIVKVDNIPIDVNEIRSDTIGILGHSRGGSITILQAYRHRVVRSVAVWSAPSYFNRYTERQRIQWRDQGFIEIQNSRTGQTMRLNISLLDDIEKNGDRLNILSASKALTSREKGLLLIAGSEDMTVKHEESEKIYASASIQFAELYIIPNTGHTFGAEYSNPVIPKPMETVLGITVNFFHRNLVEHPVPFID